MTCITYLCVCNNNNRHGSSAIIHHQPQQQSAVYPANHHNYQNWTGMQNYNLVQQQQQHQHQQQQLPEPPIAIPITGETADFGPYIDGPQPACAVYCQPSTSTAVTTAVNSVFQLQVEQPTSIDRQETVISSNTYIKSSPTTVLDLGSGTIHKSPVHFGVNSANVNWHYQSATDDYNHQRYQQNCSSGENAVDLAGGSDVGVADGIIDGAYQNQYVTVTCKTESDCIDEQGSFDLTYPMAQDLDYYAQFSSVAIGNKVNCNTGTISTINSLHHGDDGCSSMDFIGDSAGASLPSGSSSSSVGDFMDPTNNNYYMDAYSEPENNATEFNEFNINWTSTIDQYSTYNK